MLADYLMHRYSPGNGDRSTDQQGEYTTTTTSTMVYSWVLASTSLPLPLAGYHSPSPGTTSAVTSTTTTSSSLHQVTIIKKVFAENRCDKRFVFLHPVQKFVRFSHTSSLSRRWTRGATGVQADCPEDCFLFSNKRQYNLCIS